MAGLRSEVHSASPSLIHVGAPASRSSVRKCVSSWRITWSSAATRAASSGLTLIRIPAGAEPPPSVVNEPTGNVTAAASASSTLFICVRVADGGGVDQDVVRRRDPQCLGVEPDVVGDVVGQRLGRHLASRSVTTSRSPDRATVIGTDPAHGRDCGSLVLAVLPGHALRAEQPAPSRRTNVFSSVLLTGRVSTSSRTRSITSGRKTGSSP